MSAPSQRLLDHYERQTSRALAALDACREWLHTLPAPGADYITWAHVGEMSKLANDLEEIAGRK
jgi:16S rRNA G527 N7-methylase RsmG